MQQKEENNYEEWLEKINKAAGITEQAIIKEVKEEEKAVVKAFKKPFPWKSFLFIAALFLICVLPRLYFIFIVSNPENAGVGWYGDTYHHWQIAYLSKEIGFHHGFLRLWDLKGLEYFWGLAHPLTLSILMMVTGTNDIVLSRLLSTVAGSMSVVFLFLLGRKYWNMQVGLGAALLGAFNPVSIFNDASGMVEPFGMLFLLIALYLWPKRAFFAGLFLFIASMSRAEFWLFALGLVGSVFVFTKETMNKKIMIAFGYSLGILLYMKYLLYYTGNPIYPIWWNFLGNAAGKWQADIPLTPLQQMVQPIWIGIFVVALVGILFVLWKKPQSLLIHLLGLGSFLFIGFFVGLTQYIKSYINYFWVVRIFSLPYLYLGLLIAIVFFSFIPKIVPFFGKLKIGWVFILLVLAFSQLAWPVIFFYYKPTIANWDKEVTFANNIKQIYNGGTILIHEGDPVMTYVLVRYAGIKGENIEGEMYDPFQYEPFVGRSDPFSNWHEDRKIIINWLKRDNIKLLVFHFQRARYLELVKREPSIFKFIRDGEFGMKIYEVNL